MATEAQIAPATAWTKTTTYATGWSTSVGNLLLESGDSLLLEDSNFLAL
jgi:ATP-dependent protease ClpP protease subunit